MLLLSYFLLYGWTKPLLIVLLSKIMGGVGLWCHDLRRSTSNFLANSGFWYLFRIFVFVDAFYLRKPGKKFHMSCFQLARAPEGRC